MAKHNYEFEVSARPKPTIPTAFWIITALEGICLMTAVLFLPYTITENDTTHTEFRSRHAPLAINEKLNTNILLIELTAICTIFGGSGFAVILLSKRARERSQE